VVSSCRYAALELVAVRRVVSSCRYDALELVAARRVVSACSSQKWQELTTSFRDAFTIL